MSEHETRRSSDYAGFPRPLVWFIVTVKEVGILSVVIGALLYICFFRLENIKDQYATSTDRIVAALNKNTEAQTALRHFLTHKYDDN